MANANRTVTVEGYEVLAHVVCDLGRAVVLGNNSNWLGVCLQGGYPEGWEPTASVIYEFRYGKDPFVSTFRQALDAMASLALRNLSFEDGSDIDDEATPADACPTCRCLPGDGRTPGCTDPVGCGFGLAQSLPECRGCAAGQPECVTPWVHC